MPTQTIQIQIEDAFYSGQVERETQILVGPIRLDILSGEFLSIVGPAGSGKTTLLKMIAGILRATSGKIFVAGRDVQGTRSKPGVVLQNPALLPWRTCMQNILLQAELHGLDPEESRNRARRLLAWLGLSSVEDCKPHELPPGTANAISLCRALIHSPDLLLLDEPFWDIDPLAREQHLDSFQRLWGETACTVVLTTASIHEAVLLSDRIAVMSPRPGRILECIPIDIPRPRRFDKSTTPVIADHCQCVRTVLRSAGVLP